MTPLTVIHERFMRDSASLRLGSISSDLGRLANLLKSGSSDKELFQDLITELTRFTEWTAADLSIDQQKLVLDLQRDLLRWSETTLSSVNAREVQREAAIWSDRILDTSGLLS